MSSFHQFFPDLDHFRSHALLHRQSQHFEFAFSGGAAAVCEPQKVKGLRLVLSPTISVVGSEATKFDQPGFRRVQFQPKFGQSLLHGYKEAVSCLCALESVQTVIGNGCVAAPTGPGTMMALPRACPPASE